MTCWRRLQRWSEAGVFDQVHQILLAKLNSANRIDCRERRWTAVKSGTGPSPVKRGKPGSKHHLICDGNGTPIHVLTSGANVPTSAASSTCSTAIHPSPGVAVGHDAGSMCCSRTRVTTATPSGRPAVIAAPNRSSPSARPPGVKGLGKLRYVVEQTFALLHQFRRLAVRWERRLDIHDSFVSLACVLICWRRLINWTGYGRC
jgi:transposase